MGMGGRVVVSLVLNISDDEIGNTPIFLLAICKNRFRVPYKSNEILNYICSTLIDQIIVDVSLVL